MQPNRTEFEDLLKDLPIGSNDLDTINIKDIEWALHEFSPCEEYKQYCIA